MTAAEIAKELGMDPRKARKVLRAAGYHAPYDEKDRAKIIKLLKASAASEEAPKSKAPKATGKPD
jgi:hypothetical protein